jgi:hypothetical protein
MYVKVYCWTLRQRDRVWFGGLLGGRFSHILHLLFTLVMNPQGQKLRMQSRFLIATLLMLWLCDVNWTYSWKIFFYQDECEVVSCVTSLNDPLREVSSKGGGWKQPVCRANSHGDCVQILGTSTSWSPQGLCIDCFNITKCLYLLL